jgi:hypothetical protein
MSIIISTNGKKIKLPKGNNLSEGHITEKPFLGKIQEKNFIKLKELLEPHNIEFDYFYYSNFYFEETDCCASNFIIKSSCNQVFWRKYEGKTQGGGQNLVYFNGKQYNLTWLDDPNFLSNALSNIHQQEE